MRKKLAWWTMHLIARLGNFVLWLDPEGTTVTITKERKPL